MFYISSYYYGTSYMNIKYDIRVIEIMGSVITSLFELIYETFHQCGLFLLHLFQHNQSNCTDKQYHTKYVFSSS